MYNDVVMRHQKDAYHFEKQDTDPTFTASNPMCGDTFNVYLDQEKNHVSQAHFHGFGCALSKASASILMGAIENQEKEEIREFCRNFLEAADGKREWHATREIDILTELRNHGGRMDCIKLVWKALFEYLEET